MTTLVCLAAVIWVVTEKLKIPGKITSKQRTISQISRGWDNILYTLIFRLDHMHGGLELNAFSSQEYHCAHSLRLRGIIAKRDCVWL